MRPLILALLISSMLIMNTYALPTGLSEMTTTEDDDLIIILNITDKELQECQDGDILQIYINEKDEYAIKCTDYNSINQ
jgi:hypothetical protein